MRVRDNKVEHWPLHLERLSFSVSKLNFPAIDVALVKQEIDKLIEQQSEVNGIIRMTITRGSGPRGYKAPQVPSIRRILNWSSAPVSDSSLAKGVELSICDVPFSCNHSLAGVKHLNRLEQVLAQEEIPETCFDGIMLSRELIVGGSKTNIYFYHNNLWLTPKVDEAGVDGTVRRWLLGTQSDVKQTQLGLEILSEADYCMVSNALYGMIPVTKIAQHRYDVSPQLAELQLRYRDSGLVY
jgi:4-amino-4-deoxychorismate lyase